MDTKNKKILEAIKIFLMSFISIIFYCYISNFIVSKFFILEAITKKKHFFFPLFLPIPPIFAPLPLFFSGQHTFNTGLPFNNLSIVLTSLILGLLIVLICNIGKWPSLNARYLTKPLFLVLIPSIAIIFSFAFSVNYLLKHKLAILASKLASVLPVTRKTVNATLGSILHNSAYIIGIFAILLIIIYIILKRRKLNKTK
ncbi:TPA: hypothetical protein DEO28_02830 [Candidatus Dependentiae bacterium]|nr:MAG: hypothetical protein UR14_C0005G0082 [candidate division TM6 bacterium GW2011_GWE2_31_21]KKP53158.1 MAG: hypothetical protein UR43_C0007G0082 [candidate division TM6 bacterium GW2011_GWF2_33_332]HBS47978.1 hypothetical protein [Candidatus Dependentiae bacterium]HBZ73418.1 hypothetical protein [Candidatus Dependentiae bacterium]